MSSARSVEVIYDEIPLVQLRKEDKLAIHSSQPNNASEEQPLSQCWGPRNIVALSDKGLRDEQCNNFYPSYTCTSHSSSQLFLTAKHSFPPFELRVASL